MINRSHLPITSSMKRWVSLKEIICYFQRFEHGDMDSLSQHSFPKADAEKHLGRVWECMG